MSVSFSESDQRFMREALALAATALFDTDPNPRVGCVIVNNGQVVGRGAHLRAGTPHAEVHALADAGSRALGATCYVTLEPCNHHGRTPPCSEALIAAGVERVVVAMSDHSPQAAGGAEQLRTAGIEVQTGLLSDESRELNPGFHQRCETGKPWLRLKLASSLDGRIAAADGSSQWITGPEARADGQYWRARASKIVTGAATVRSDNPRLDVRLAEAQRQPQRVILSHTFDVSPSAHIFAEPGEACVYAPMADVNDAVVEQKRESLAAAGISTHLGPHRDEQLDLLELITMWGREGANELHFECGAALAGQLLEQDLVDELLLYLAPALVGSSGFPLAQLPKLQSIQQALRYRVHDCRMIGDDVRLLLRRGES